MHKKFIVLGMTSVVFLSGCQSIGDQLGKQMAKSVVEQATGGKVKLDDLDSGKMTIKTEDGTMQFNGNGKDGGSMTIKDKNGKEIMNADSNEGNFSVKDEKGNEVMKGNKDGLTIKDENGKTTTMTSAEGETRPANAPADLPTVDGGKQFSLVTVGDNVVLSYEMAGKELKGNCQKQLDLLTGQGWAVDSVNSLSLETAESIMKIYGKGAAQAIVSCGVDEDKVTITVQKGPKPTN